MPFVICFAEVLKVALSVDPAWKHGIDTHLVCQGHRLRMSQANQSCFCSAICLHHLHPVSLDWLDNAFARLARLQLCMYTSVFGSDCLARMLDICMMDALPGVM